MSTEQPPQPGRAMLVVMPAIAMALAAPFGVMGLWDAKLWYATPPVALGLLAAPGYIDAWRAVRAARRDIGARRVWGYASIGLGIVAALLGAVLSLFAVILPVLGAFTVSVAAQLLFEFKRIGESTQS